MKIVIRKGNYHFLSILFCAYLINVFYLKNIVTVHRLATWGAVILYILGNINVVLRLLQNARSYVNRIVIPVLLWIALIFVTPFIHGTGDYTYISMLKTMTGTLLNALVVLIIAYKYKGDESCSDSFMHIFMYAMSYYVIFTIICILIPQVKLFVVNTVDISSENMRLIGLRKYATRIGWAGFSGYSCSLKCSIANIFALHFIMDDYLNKKKQNTINVIVYLLTLIGIFFYSRTGLLAALIIIILTFIYNLKTRNILSSLWFVVILILLIAAVPLLETLALTNRSLGWILEPILNLTSDDGLSTTTTSHIFNDMLFSLNKNQLIFGDGRYTGPNGYYMKTDLGFMRLILYFGIPGLIVTYSIVLASISNIRHRFRTLDRSYFTLYWIVLFSIFEFKGESIQIIIPVLIILSISIFTESSKRSITIENRGIEHGKIT